MPKRLSFKFDEKTNLIAYLWTPEKGKAKAVIQISHGMAENILRYDDFANFLTTKGFIVIGHDHYAHGESAESIEKIGVVEKYDFMDAIIKGMKLIHDEAKELYPILPFYLFAHSMGSMAAQRYIQLYPDDFQKVVLSGTDVGSLQYVMGKLVANILIKLKGPISYPKIVNQLSLGAFAKQFPDEKSPYSWLSSNPEVVSEYEENPYCGATFPTNYFYSLSKLLLEAKKGKNIAKINPKLKVLLIGGSKDPVSHQGKSILKLNKIYKKNKINSKYIIYPDARHECLNERKEIRDKVYQDVDSFFLS